LHLAVVEVDTKEKSLSFNRGSRLTIGCGLVSRDLGKIRRHFAQFLLCQYQQEPTRKMLRSASSAAAATEPRHPESGWSPDCGEEGVPISSTDARLERDACRGVKPSGEQQQIGVEDDGFPPIDEQMEYPEDSAEVNLYGNLPTPMMSSTILDSRAFQIFRFTGRSILIMH
jgi:hypothetical protein